LPKPPCITPPAKRNALVFFVGQIVTKLTLKISRLAYIIDHRIAFMVIKKSSIEILYVIFIEALQSKGL